MKGKSSERLPTTISDSNDDRELEERSRGTSANPVFISSLYDSCVRDPSLTVLVSVTLSVVRSTDFVSDEDEELAADSRIRSSRKIAEFDGEIRFGGLSDWATCGTLTSSSGSVTGWLTVDRESNTFAST